MSFERMHPHGWTQEIPGVGTIHSGGANIAFCDAHVEFGKPAEWMKKTDTARRRCNNDHEPHPETW